MRLYDASLVSPLPAHVYLHEYTPASLADISFTCRPYAAPTGPVEYLANDASIIDPLKVHCEKEQPASLGSGSHFKNGPLTVLGEICVGELDILMAAEQEKNSSTITF